MKVGIRPRKKIWQPKSECGKGGCVANKKTKTRLHHVTTGGKIEKKSLLSDPVDKTRPELFTESLFPRSQSKIKGEGNRQKNQG